MTTMHRFKHKRALVTGASSGIGQAIARALAAEGAEVHAVARQWPTSLEASLAAEQAYWQLHTADLAVESQLINLAATLCAASKPMDVLIHSAGMYATGDVADMAIAMLDQLYQVNVRAPFLLTQKLLPALIASCGQVVFINSSAGIASKSGLAGYSSTKFALKSIADALRAEVNPQGVRVMSVYPGKTASKMQEAAHQGAGQAYDPARLMQPDDIAQMVLSALALPATAEMTDLHIRPMNK